LSAAENMPLAGPRGSFRAACSGSLPGWRAGWHTFCHLGPLCLNICSDLPYGPYLDNLQTLLLGGNKLTRMPQVLRHATALEVRAAWAS